ncbi:MAG: cation:dicarboxylate symporter family transporter, partial [Pseudomonas sp.]
MKNRYLARAIVIAIILGVLVGAVLHAQLDTDTAKTIAAYFSMVTDVFLRLIKMVIAPLVLATLISGVASMADSGSIGRVGLKEMTWFLIAYVVSLLIGLT